MILLTQSIQGSLHRQYQVANQDQALIWAEDGWVIGICCDGVSLNSKGEFSHSEIASDLVAEKAMKYLKNHLEESMVSSQILQTIYESFEFANGCLNKSLISLEIDPVDCQTTLIVFVWKNGSLYCGLAGDGGIVFQKSDQTVGLIVTRIKTSSAVLPIFDRQGWRFTSVEAENGIDVKRVIAATDGVFDALVIPYDDGVEINESLLQEFYALDQEKEKQKRFDLILAKIPSHDDKTAIYFSRESLSADPGKERQPE